MKRIVAIVCTLVLGSYGALIPRAGATTSCVGVAMTQGQADINNNPAGTTFCVTGTHYGWTLTPKAGDKIIGPATLDGQGSVAHAVVATAPNVRLGQLIMQHYAPPCCQDAVIHIDDSDSAKATASGWILNYDRVRFNRGVGSGTGNGWKFTGGRYRDNTIEGIGGAMGNHVTINQVEIDHNNFTDSTYTTRNHSCGDEAGGVKWVTDYLTIMNSYVHDNACKGIWADLSAEHSFIDHNTVAGNWDEGIFIEISSTATVTSNTINGNGLKNYNQGNACSRSFGWAGGITISTSGKTAAAGTGSIDVGSNNLSGNCQGITGVDSFRDEGPCPCELWNVNIHDNTIAGAGQTGSWADDGDNLATHGLVYARNTLSGGATFCGLSC